MLSQDDNIRVGDNFMQKMHEFLIRGRDLIIVLSPAYDQSKYTVLEFTSFLAAAMRGTEKRRLIMLRVVECEPPGLLAGFVYKDLVPIADIQERRRVIVNAVKDSDPLDLNDFDGLLRSARQNTSDGLKELMKEFANAMFEGFQSKIDAFESQTLKIADDFRSQIVDFIQRYSEISPTGIPFIGRTAELKLLQNWLEEDDDHPYHLILAPAGRGKSALLVRWLMRQSHKKNIDIIFFPVSIRYNTNTANAVLMALASQLAKLRGDKAPELFGTPVEVLRNMVQGYLQRDAPPERTTLIILDGLDEAQDQDSFRGLFPFSPGSRIKVLLSARSFPGEQNGFTWLELLGMSSPTSHARASRVIVTSLQHLPAGEIRTSVQNALADHIKPEELDNVASELTRLTDGEPFVLRMYLEQLLEEENIDPGRVLAQLEVVEPGLMAYFKQWWSQQETLWKRSDFSTEQGLVVLRVLAMAVGPMTIEEIQAVAGEQISANHIRMAISRMHRFIIGTGTGKRFTLVHDKFFEFVRQELMDERERQACLDKIVDWGLSEVEKAGRSPAEEDHKIPEYLVLHLGVHLQANKRRMSLSVTLLDRPWADAWYALEGNHSGYLVDLDRIFRWVATRFVDSADPRVQDEMFLLMIRVVLVRSSVVSAAESLPSELVFLLLSEGVWNSGQALSYIGILADEMKRSDMLTAINKVVELDKADQYLDLAFSAPEQVRGVEPLVFIAPLLPATALPKFLRLVKKVKNQFFLARVLTGLKGRLDTHLTTEVIAMLNSGLETSKSEHTKFNLTLALAGFVAPERRLAVLERAVGFARQITPVNSFAGSRSYKCLFLCEAGQAFGDPAKAKTLYQEALAVLGSPPDSREPELGFEYIAPFFANTIFEEALVYARRIDPEDERKNATQLLISHLDLQAFPMYAPIADKVILETIDRAGSWEDERYYNAVRALGKKLKGPYLEKYASSIPATEDLELGTRFQLLWIKNLEGQEQSSAADRLVAELFRRPHFDDKAKLLSEAAVYLERRNRPDVARKILNLAQNINDSYDVKNAQITYLSRCDEAQIHALDSQFVAASLYPAIRDVAMTLPARALVDRFSDAQRQLLLNLARKHQAEWTSWLLMRLSDHIGKGIAIEDYLDAIAAIKDDTDRFLAGIWRLNTVAASPEELATLEAAFLLLCNNNDDYENCRRALEYSMEKAQMAFFAEIFPKLSSPYQRFRTGVWALPLLKEMGKLEVFQTAAATAFGSPDLGERVQPYVIAYMAEHLDEPILIDLITIAQPNLEREAFCSFAAALLASLKDPALREALLQQYLLKLQELLDLVASDTTADENDVVIEEPFRLLVEVSAKTGLPSWVPERLFRMIDEAAKGGWDKTEIMKIMNPVMDERHLRDYIDLALGLQQPGERVEFIVPALEKLAPAQRQELIKKMAGWVDETRVDASLALALLCLYDEQSGIDLFTAAKRTLWQFDDFPYEQDVAKFVDLIGSWTGTGRIAARECRELIAKMFEALGFKGRANVFKLLNGLLQSDYIADGDAKLPVILGQITRTVREWP